MNKETTLRRSVLVCWSIAAGVAMLLGACSDDADPSASDRSRTATLVRERARCACEDGGYERIEDCAERNAFGREYNACSLSSWTAGGASEADLDCWVEATEASVACYEAIDGCDADAVQTCDDLLDTAVARCNPAFIMFPSDAYFDSFEACVAADVVGPALGCRATGVQSRVGDGVFAGTTVGGGDDFQPSCETVSSADAEHAWEAPSSGRFRFDTNGSYAEVALAVHDGCNGPELECAFGSDSGPPNRQAVLEMDLTAGQQVVLVIDSLFESSVGPYRINITAL